MYQFEPMRVCLDLLGFMPASFRMVAFGHASWKPTVLMVRTFGNEQWAAAFATEAKQKAKAALEQKAY